MKAIEFTEVNVRIAENQPEYETLPASIHFNPEYGMNEVTVCFELDEEEKKQIAETGKIWFTVLQPLIADFRPIRMSVLKPSLSQYCTCKPDDTSGWTEFNGKLACNICGKQIDPASELSEDECKEWEAIGRKPAE